MLVALEDVESKIVRTSGFILVADDEPIILRLAQTVLKRHGYRVLVAENGDQALKLYNENPHVDLVITDVVMPQTNGPQLVHQIHEIDPGVRCVFMSGYSPEHIREQGGDPGCLFLRKPFTPDKLIEAVQQMLAA